MVHIKALLIPPPLHSDFDSQTASSTADRTNIRFERTPCLFATNITETQKTFTIYMFLLILYNHFIANQVYSTNFITKKSFKVKWGQE